MEGILYAVKGLTTLAQKEDGYLGAYRPLLVQSAITKLQKDTIPVLRLGECTPKKSSEGVYTPQQRHDKEVKNFTPASKELRRRVLLEIQRRFCGNTTEEVDDTLTYVYSKRDYLCSFLDPRVLHWLEDKDAKKALEFFISEYVEFGLNAFKYNLDKQRREEPAVSPAVSPAAAPAAAAPATLPAVSEVRSATGLVFGKVTADDLFGPDITQAVEVDLEEERKKQLLVEASVVAKNWFIYTDKEHLDWKKIDPQVKLQSPTKNPEEDIVDEEDDGAMSQPDPVEELIDADVAQVFRNIINSDADTKKSLGLIPLMASCSRGQLAALTSESFCERCISAANNIVNKQNMMLTNDEVSKLTVLRINREFMKYVRIKYDHVKKFEDLTKDVFTVPDSKDDEVHIDE